MTDERGKVLVVDDDPGSLKSLRRILSLDGYDVETASSVAECLARENWHDYLAVLLDRRLGDGTAEDVLPHIRRLSPDVAVIIITGYADLESSVAALREGASDYLIKPLNPEMLRTSLRRMAQLREAQQALERSRGKLRKSEERLQLAVRATKDAIWDCDLVAHTVWWNEHYDEAFGTRPKETRDSWDWWLDHIHPDDRERVETAFLEATDGTAPNFEAEYRYLRTDGSWADVLDRAFVSRDSDGKVVRILGAMTDITERKKLEAEYLQAQKMEAVGRLAGGIAHDFNNLLAGLIAACGIVRLQLEPGHPAQGVLQDAENEGMRGAQMARQLLDFSRHDSGQARHFEVRDVVSAAEKVLQRVLGGDIDLRVTCAATGGAICADPGRIEQVLMNLVINSRDAMPQGGEIVLDVRDVELSEDEARQKGELQAGPYVLVSVSDNGEGMSRETQEKAFEPFFTTKDVGQGTGLGLPSVVGIVRDAGGRVECDSELGRGTTFRLFFPRSEAPRPAEEPAAPGKPQQGQQETVLVVEDTSLIRAGIRALLMGLGYRVLDAGTPAEALELVAALAKPVDLLLTDIVMPGMSGPELVEQLRVDTPNLRVVYMSAFTGEALARQGRLAAGLPLLEKPFTEEELAQKVRLGLSSSAEPMRSEESQPLKLR